MSWKDNTHDSLVKALATEKAAREAAERDFAAYRETAEETARAYNAKHQVWWDERTAHDATRARVVELEKLWEQERNAADVACTKIEELTLETQALAALHADMQRVCQAERAAHAHTRDMLQAELTEARELLKMHTPWPSHPAVQARLAAHPEPVTQPASGQPAPDSPPRRG